VPIVLLAGAYFIAGKLGLSLAFVHASATPVWPPTGIALAALLLLGYRVWPGVLIGAFLVNVTTAGSLASSAGIAVGNTLEGLLAAFLVNTFANGRHAFERPHDVFKFAVVAAVISTAVSATFGVGTLSLTGYASWSDFGAIWLTWWLGDAAGALVVAPALVLCATTRPIWERGRWLETAALAVALLITSLAVFGGLHPFSAKHYPFEFVVFPVLVWAAFRFSPREAAISILVLSAFAVWGTLRGNGPFVGDTQNESLLLLQSFMAVAAVMSMVLAAAVLDRRRAEETIHATEERLRLEEQRKVAERDAFLSVAAHELRTPMTSLRVAVQLLMRRLERGDFSDAEALGRSLRRVNDQSAKLTRLMNQLLDTVRLRAGHLECDLKLEDVTRLVEDAVEQSRATTDRHDIALSAPPSVMAQVDAVRLEQVITNLLDNAIKFSPEGGRIDVELSADNGTVRLAVRDRGVGVELGHRPHIFERFYRADREDQRSGMGLGLHVSRNIVELHGGQIEAQFPSDGGTRLVVTLPRRMDDSSAERADGGRVLAT
jgi:signal transduction histidine kinase